MTASPMSRMSSAQPPAPPPSWSLDKIAAALIVATALGSALVYPWLPARVPSHLDWRGQVDGTLPRAVGAFLMPLIAAPVLAAVRSVARRRELGDSGRTAMEALALLTTLLLVGLHGMLLTLALLPGLDASRFLGVFFGLFWGGCGLIFPRLQRNPVAGIRTPWTLASDDNWARTHRFGGQLAFLGGILAIVTSLAGRPAPAFAAIGLSAVLPAVYSYWIRER